MATEERDKRSRTCDSPVRELNGPIESLRAGPDGRRFVPWFDPDGAGSAARVLLLMESPGPKAVAVGDLGFSSLDNDDATSRPIRAALYESGLDAGLRVRWNLVPWALYDLTSLTLPLPTHSCGTRPSPANGHRREEALRRTVRALGAAARAVPLTFGRNHIGLVNRWGHIGVHLIVRDERPDRAPGHGRPGRGCRCGAYQ